MTKKYWIAGALGVCLMASYWLSDEQTAAAAANIEPAQNIWHQDKPSQCGVLYARSSKQEQVAIVYDNMFLFCIFFFQK